MNLFELLCDAWLINICRFGIDLSYEYTCVTCYVAIWDCAVTFSTRRSGIAMLSLYKFITVSIIVVKHVEVEGIYISRLYNIRWGCYKTKHSSA